MKSRCTAVLILILLSACMRQYSAPQLDPKDAVFKGVASYLSDTPEVQVIVVHGMCAHEAADWIDKGWDEHIRRALSAAVATRTENTRALTKDAPYYLEQRVYPVGSKRLDARFVMWSGSTNEFKKRLIYDNQPPSGRFEWRRARINAAIKAGLINDCLSDAVIYAGTYGDTLRETMKQAMCEALDLEYDSAAHTCGQELRQHLRTRPVIVITESLGSKIVFDSLLEMTASGGSEAFEQSLASVPQIYMLANQLPLLDLAQRTVDSPGRLTGDIAEAEGGATAERFAKTLLAARKAKGTLGTSERAMRASQSDVSIVAFTDPNDLLSYRLEHDGWPDGVTVTNVLTSNAGSLFGSLVEDPRAAHTTYNINEDVMRLILCGTAKEDCKRLQTEATK